MPLKPTKRGIKVWLRAEFMTHYVSLSKFTREDLEQENLNADLVLELLLNFLKT